MSATPADLRIEARWIAPMSDRNAVLENHSLVVRDGRILDILPSLIAAQRYAATAVLQRKSHLLMPGMINAQSDAAMLLKPRGTRDAAAAARDGTLLGIAEMLKSGVTCFCDRYYFPEETARAANEQGMRAVVGMPVAETATPWAANAAQSLTRALGLRDKFKGEALVSTVFAPRAASSLSDDTFSRLITLADELDAGIMIDLHQSLPEIDECLAAHGVRPIERLWKLGLLSPALNAVHMLHLSAADLGLMQRTGIAVTLCPQWDLHLGGAVAPLAAFSAAGSRVGIGSAGADTLSKDLWGDMKLIALLSSPWDALHAATAGGAMVLGLDSEVGSLQAGKWADVCCVDLAGPATLGLREPLSQLVLNGGRELVSDVWVAGRQLLSGGELTRLDWQELALRIATLTTTHTEVRDGTA